MRVVAPEESVVAYWVESTHTPSHLERFAEITREVAKLGVSQLIMSGVDGLHMAEERSGSLVEFGFPSEVEIVALPTSREDYEGDEPEAPHDPTFALWQYMNDPIVVRRRRLIIQDMLTGVSERGQRISHVIPEMYPVGMCILGAEVEFLHTATKVMFPDAKMMPLARDIPAIIPGSRFNDPYDQLDKMRRFADALFVRGDAGVLEQNFEMYGIDDSVVRKLRNVGHFIGHITPERDTSIADADRKVLVSAGGSSSAAARDQNEYYAFYRRILEAKPYTQAVDRIWTVCIPDDFPADLRAEIAALAQNVGGVELLGSVPIDSHRQAIADSALFVTVTGYSSMLAGLQSEVPTVVVPAQIQKSGVQRDVIDRSQLYHDQGLVTQITVPQLSNLHLVANLMNQRLAKGPAPKEQIPQIDGARTLANYIQSDLSEPQ